MQNASDYVANGGTRPPTEAMIDCIDDHRGFYRAEPICRVLPIAPSTCRAHVAGRVEPAKRSLRAQHDLALVKQIR